MGCEWSQLEETDRANSGKTNTNHSIPVSYNDANRQNRNKPQAVIPQQLILYNNNQATDHNNRNVVSGTVNHSHSRVAGNSESSSSNDSTLDESIEVIQDPTNTLGPVERQSRIDDVLSQRNHSRQQENSQHHRTFNKETVPIPVESTMEKDLILESVIIDDSIQDLATSEYASSKRILSKTSVKHSLPSHPNDDQDDFVDDDIVSLSDTSIVDTTISIPPATTENQIELIDADPEAFNTVFLRQRQTVLDNKFYRPAIESWSPDSLPELKELIIALSKGKPLVDRHWIVFYWITCNIEYDTGTGSFFTGNITDQIAEDVFRTKKGVCAGYSRLYKYLCDQLGIACEEIFGYVKGYGYSNRQAGSLLETDHAWNAVEIEGHWYLLDSAWGTGRLVDRKIYRRELNCHYFLTRPCQLICDHLPENNQWQFLQKPITMTEYLQLPKFHPTYFDLNIELISPLCQAHLSLVQNKSYAKVFLRAPDNVKLSGRLINSKGQKVKGGDRVYYDREISIWKCKFAPDKNGSFTATVFGKKNLDTSYLSEVVSFRMEATDLLSSSVSFPYTWQTFYDCNLKVVFPRDTSTVPWSESASYAEVYVQAPDYIELSCRIEYEGSQITNGTLAQYDHENRLWQLLFAPEHAGQHELFVFAKRNDDKSASCAVKFYLNVSQIRKPMKFPTIYDTFHTHRCQLYEPLDGILKKGAKVSIHCSTPGAMAVNVQVDSVWTKTKGYQDPVYNQTITVGSKDITIYAKYGQRPCYEGLIKYSVL